MCVCVCVEDEAAGRFAVNQKRRLRFGDSAQVHNIDRYREMERYLSL